MTTYTLAIGADVLLATARDGADVRAIVAADPNARYVGNYDTIAGCTLTDAEPSATDEVVWHSGDGGWIFDENGYSWRFAVRHA